MGFRAHLEIWDIVFFIIASTFLFFFLGYFNDLSLFEIADNAHVSRNAVHDQLKKVIDNLDNYENKLGLLKKENKLNELLEEYASSNNSEVLDLINKLKNME